jgi:hypothetical protein
MKNRIKTYFSHARVLLVALAVAFVAVVIVLVYGYERFDLNFLDNLIATTFGVMFGFVIGLVANSVQTSEQKLAADEAARKHLQGILGRIQAELSYNLDALKVREDLLGMNEGEKPLASVGVFYQHRLKAELWDALRYGGESQYITDVAMLEAITTAYHDLRTLALLEEHALVRYEMRGGGMTPGEVIEEERALLTPTCEDVQAALAAMRM